MNAKTFIKKYQNTPVDYSDLKNATRKNIMVQNRTKPRVVLSAELFTFPDLSTVAVLWESEFIADPKKFKIIKAGTERILNPHKCELMAGDCEDINNLFQELGCPAKFQNPAETKKADDFINDKHFLETYPDNPKVKIITTEFRYIINMCNLGKKQFIPTPMFQVFMDFARDAIATIMETPIEDFEEGE